MGQALYRKYRSKTFSEVVGQEPITQTLQKAIKSGGVSHAYLFSGPRGVGKTTVARILAHRVNNLPYKDESIHLDIIEIDGASNRRIDEVRELRDKINISPTSAQYKVYIIDEVHMLTREAFNALLKTLEEPPAHCIFILATTEVHKLPETIISRTQHFSFKPIEPTKVAKHLEVLAKKEKLTVEPQALQLLAEYGAGSFRDSINLLDQLSSTAQKITEKVVSELIGSPPNSLILGLIDAIRAAQPKKVLEILDKLRDQGAAPAAIAARLSRNLRQEILKADSLDCSWMTKLLKNLLEVAASRQPQEILEIAVLQTSTSRRRSSGEVKSPVQPDPLPPSGQRSSPVTPTKKAQPIIKKPASTASFNLERWPLVLAAVKSRAGSLYTALRLASPKLDGNSLHLFFQFALHHTKASESQHIELVEKLIKELTGADLIVKCFLDKTISKPAPQKTSSTKNLVGELQAEDLQTISNIFGKSEVLES
ncbi:DNA polymerase III subunit gamma/tau [Candidatus Saccharibacteria bacterium]|nr:DNA polymerase III subunit gamma/tau [Candidatus Saccharibacteria bacterium]